MVAPYNRFAMAGYERDGIGSHLLLGYAVIVALLGVGTVWAGATQISGAVVAQGTVVVQGRAKAVQHPDGGTVARIAVRDGDFVSAGETLIELDTQDLAQQRSGLTEQINASVAEIELVKAEHESLTPLFEKQLVTRARMVSLDREAVRLEGQLSRLESTAAQIDARIDKAEITAPVDGYLLGMTVHTVGGVIEARDTIAEIVPADDTRVVEARIQPSDIDKISIGQAAVIRLSALDGQDAPELAGNVIHVSADRIEDEVRGAVFYETRLALDPETTPRWVFDRMLPGMPVEVFVRTSDRTVLSYLLKPLNDSLRRAFRE